MVQGHGQGPGCASPPAPPSPSRTAKSQDSASPSPRHFPQPGFGEPWALMTYLGVHEDMDEKGQQYSGSTSNFKPHFHNCLSCGHLTGKGQLRATVHTEAVFLNLQAGRVRPPRALRTQTLDSAWAEDQEQRADAQSSCFLLPRKAGPFPTIKLHLDIPAGKSPSKSPEAPSLHHQSRKFLFPVNSAALTPSFVRMASSPGLAWSSPRWGLTSPAQPAHSPWQVRALAGRSPSVLPGFACHWPSTAN